LAVANKLGQCREEVLVLNAPRNVRYPKGEMAKKGKGICLGSESRRSYAAQFTRKTKSLELVPVGKNLVKTIALEDATDVEVSKVPDRNEGRGVAPCTMLDCQRMDPVLEVFEELIEMRCLSTLCGEGKVF
jgi:hypothetical protein